MFFVLGQDDLTQVGVGSKLLYCLIF